MGLSWLDTVRASMCKKTEECLLCLQACHLFVSTLLLFLVTNATCSLCFVHSHLNQPLHCRHVTSVPKASNGSNSSQAMQLSICYSAGRTTCIALHEPGCAAHACHLQFMWMRRSWHMMCQTMSIQPAMMMQQDSQLSQVDCICTKHAAGKGTK